jgi:hypothetical protein
VSERVRRVCVVGSAAFPLTAEIGAQIVDLLRALPPGTAILTRGRGTVDEFVGHVALALGLRCLTYPSKGGADNWDRDVELARDADEVIALFASASLADMNTGTAHLVEKALDQKRPVRAFTEIDNQLVYAGATE